MIRYVLAVVLTVALVGIGWAGLEHAAAVRGEQQVENAIAKIDEAAVSLVENDDPPAAGQEGPRRVVELDLPHDGLASERVETFHIRPGPRNVSVAEYTFDGRAVHAVTIDAPIRDGNTNQTATADLSGETGSTMVVLTLEQDDDAEYVELQVPPAG